MSSKKPSDKKQKKKRKVGKVNPILYALVYAFAKPYFTLKYSVKFDKEAVRSMKNKPSIVIATHTCDMDHILSAMTLYPIRPTYVVSEHFTRKKSTARLLRIMKVITKKMFTPDASTIVNIVRAIRENSTIVIFPEGRLSCYGHSLPVASGTAELIKKLGVDLYIWKASGAYLTFPKWREKKGDRRGSINASVKLLLSKEEVEKATLDELRLAIESAIEHDDELAMQGVRYRSKAIAKGVDKILYKCPACQGEGTLSSGNTNIKCTCGLNVTLDNTYRLSGAPFSRINEWFEWQMNTIDTENDKLTSYVRLGACTEDGFMDERAGDGMAYLDKDVFILSGTIHGEKVEFSLSTDKIVAFPITAGEHFDVYYHGKLIYVYPLPDTRLSVKWVCFLDKLSSDKRNIQNG